MPFYILFPFGMFLQNTFLTALVGLGAAFLSGNAHAQSTDSTSSIKSRSVAVQAKDSARAQTKTIRLVSRSTIPVGTGPLYIVDGRPIQEEELKSINPNDIENIEIVKGITATAIYGSRATSGVIVMTMKHPDSKPLHQPNTKKGRLD
jgi:TonB-dependent SusC/RagA subfamily outer membrane receptor